MDNLTTKQQRFCEEYVVDWNATQAAIRAGYSEKTADVQGARLLVNVKVRDFINICKQRTAELAGVSAVQNAVWLLEIAKSKENHIRDRIKAIEVLNKMEGYDSPTRIDHTTQGEQMNSKIEIVLVGSQEPLPQNEDDIDEDI